MALKFHPLKVKEIVKETREAISILFELPSELRDLYQYKAGQYLTLQLHIDGERYRRAYSLSSCPFIDSDPKVTVKRVEGGKVSNYLNDYARPGMIIEVLPPMGNFTPPISAAHRDDYFLYAGGSGITPVISILKSVLEVEKESRVTLFYGNHSPSSIIFYEELKEWGRQFPDRLKLIHVLENGSLSEEEEWHLGMLSREATTTLLKKYASPGEIEAGSHYICGPGPMMDEVEAALDELGIDKKKIHIERFTAAPAEEEEAGHEDLPEAIFPAEAVIILDGNQYEIEVQKKETLLEAAIENNIDPPYACQMGVCTTCRALLREGKVEMDEREALTDEEIEEGYILTCQSHPLTHKVVVDYDA
jgi:ring-1,2-phenylacetyl-CoA epoxidase subunit PaaE